MVVIVLKEEPFVKTTPKEQFFSDNHCLNRNEFNLELKQRLNENVISPAASYVQR